MIERMPSLLAGKVVSHFSIFELRNIGIERLIIHLGADDEIAFLAKEIKIGKDEIYTLDADTSLSQLGARKIQAGWRIGRNLLLQRQDWIEQTPYTGKTIGNNARVLTWGRVGCAPNDAVDRRTINFGIAFFSEDGNHQAMIHIADYPGTLCFTQNAQEISSLCDTYTNVLKG